jgi:putative alpha-1,2-mannosidase
MTTRARCCGRASASHPDGTVTGFRETRGWAPGRQLYFAMRFSKPMVGQLQNREENVPYNGFRQPGRGQRPRPGQGRQLEAAFDFGPIDRSPAGQGRRLGVDEAGAIKNLESEGGQFDFDGLRASTRAAWNRRWARCRSTPRPRCGPPSTPPCTTP